MLIKRDIPHKIAVCPFFVGISLFIFPKARRLDAPLL
jgi:hypothetical protein